MYDTQKVKKQQSMRINTNALDRAAFLLVYVAKLVEIKGRYPDNQFILDVPRAIAWYEQLGGWVPYSEFCNKRREIKRKIRKLAGLPLHFTGDGRRGFTLGDIAIVKQSKK